MAGHNYLTDPKNPFLSLEDDVDDETFLRNASARTGHHGFDNDIDQYRQQMLQLVKEVEERTVQSSERSVSLLRDSEQIGIATAETLIRQKEKLQRTEKKLDDINRALKISQKHIQGMKSVFGSLKNYLGDKLLDAPPIPSTKLSESSSSGSTTSPALSNTLEQMQNDMSNSLTMIRRSYDDNSKMLSLLKDVKPTDDRVTRVLEENLSEMSGSVAKLKHLAIGLSEEINSQKKLIDNITNKTEKTDITLEQQTEEILHQLKK